MEPVALPATDGRLTQLGRVTAELAAARDFDAVIEIVVSHVADAMQAAMSTLSTLNDDQTLTLVGIRGGRRATEELWATYPLSAQLPACDALRTNQVVFVSGVAEIERRYPALAGLMPEERSVLCLPLIVGAQPIGVIGLVFRNTWAPGDRELDFLRIFADTCAQAVLRVRAVDEAAVRTSQLAFLADASVELASSLDYRSTLANVARLAVPRLADWCGVDTLQDGVLQRLAVAHVDAAKVAWAQQLQERYPPDPHGESGVAKVVRTGVSELYPEITDEMLVAAARDAEHLQLCRDLNLRSVLIVPLVALDRILGAITLVRAETPQRYGPAELAVAEDLGRRAGVAIENAQLHSQTRDLARQLRRAVLPDRLDNIPGWAIATHSSPAARSEVGGDFYDALPLPDGRLVVFIGDVMGHGVEAAAAMAQMRAAVRAYVASDPDPATVLQRLDGMSELFEISRLVTLALLVIDPALESLAIVNAGHCPGLVVTAQGDAHYINAPVGRPVGAGHEDRTAVNCPFARGSTLLLYTDGLIERRGEDIDASLARLAQYASCLTCDEVADGLGKLVDTLQDDGWDDDVTALAVRAAGSALEAG